MVIHHVLKDGTEVGDITGIVINAEDYPMLYEVINRIQQLEGDEYENGRINRSSAVLYECASNLQGSENTN